MTSRTFASSCESVENLKLPARHGCNPYSRHTLATLTLDRPSSAASSRPGQRVTPSRCGGGSKVRNTTATSSVVRGLPGFGRSSSPPTPSTAYRRFHAITVGLDTPVRRTISLVPSPPPPAKRSGPAAPARPGSTATAPRGQHLTVARRNLHVHSQRHKPSSANDNQRSRFLVHATLRPFPPEGDNGETELVDMCSAPIPALSTARRTESAGRSSGNAWQRQKAYLDGTTVRPLKVYE